MTQQLALFDYEQMPLEKLEEIIDRGLSPFIEVGLALLAIGEGKKYQSAGFTDCSISISKNDGEYHTFMACVF